jgi:hypothetical protein
MVRMDRSFGGFVFIGQMAWLGAVCFCWSRADVVGHLIEEVGIMLEVGCLFETLRKALGARAEAVRRRNPVKAFCRARVQGDAVQPR